MLLGLATSVRMTIHKTILLSNVIYRRMIDEYKTEKGKDVWNKGSRLNEIISWHVPGVIKEKHEKLSSYKVSKRHIWTQDHPNTN